MWLAPIAALEEVGHIASGVDLREDVEKRGGRERTHDSSRYEFGEIAHG